MSRYTEISAEGMLFDDAVKQADSLLAKMKSCNDPVIFMQHSLGIAFLWGQIISDAPQEQIPLMTEYIGEHITHLSALFIERFHPKTPEVN